MFRPRVIPVLLLKGRGLVKSVRFGSHKYVGDPINAVRIFNDLRADELVFLDIDASREDRLISLDFVREVGEEASMPFSVGGGIRSIDDVAAVIGAGAEKVVIGSHAATDPGFVRRAADTFGSSTVVVCIDVKRKFFKGRRTCFLNGTRATEFDPVTFARLMENNGAGELIIQSVERDGTMGGYDIDLVREVSSAVGVPVVALGGAGRTEDLVNAYRDGRANGLAAGSLFVYKDKRRGVLINYPERGEVMFN
jgi:cyclase